MLVVALPHYEFIRVSGADTVTFLQGQVSCDVTALTPERSLTGALCNLKGRVIADFRLLRQGEDCLLQTYSGMARIILDVLNKYAVFSKVDLQLESAMSAAGIMGNGAAEIIAGLVGEAPQPSDGVVQAEGFCVLAIAGPEPRFEIWAANENPNQAKLDALLRQGPAGELLDWQRQDFRAGLLHVTPELSEQYTPQLLNYDISGVINFRKGCYTGQEVVARMYYRGKAKKRLHLFQSDQAISSAAEKPTSNFTLLAQAAPTANDPDGHLLLAVVDSVQENTDGAQLVASDGSRLQKLDLPYLPSAA